jgi:hypothetical protein
MRRTNQGSVLPGNLRTKVAEVEVPSHQSAWFLTINTNMRFDDNDPKLDETALILTETLEEFFGEKQHLIKGIKFKNTHVIQDYDEARYLFVPERSSKTLYLHAHGVLDVIHHSNIHLNSKVLQDLLTLAMRARGAAVEGCYVNFKYIPSDEWNSQAWNNRKMYEYITKNRKFDEKKSNTVTKLEVQLKEKEQEERISALTKAIDSKTDFFDFGDDEEEPVKPVKKPKVTPKRKVVEEDEDEPKPTTSFARFFMDSDSESEEPVKPVKKPKVTPKHIVEEEPEEEPVKQPKRKFMDSDSEEELIPESNPSPNPNPKPEPKKPKSGVNFRVFPLPDYKKHLVQ